MARGGCRTLPATPAAMEPQAQVMLEALEALAQVTAECLPSGPPHAHGDAASSLSGGSLALPAPPLLPASGSATPAGAAAPKRSHPVGPRKSDFVGVSWYKNSRQWRVYVHHTGEKHQLGRFDDEQEAARAFDTAARRLRPKGEAHGGRSGNQWWCLNFPTAEEKAFAAQHGPGAGVAAEPSTVALKAKAQGFNSDFVGVSWYKNSRQWSAQISHSGNPHQLGRFDDEQEAARAFDTAARRLRPEGEAHGGRAGPGRNWVRLNFPTTEEEAFADGGGMPPPKKKRKT